MKRFEVRNFFPVLLLSWRFTLSAEANTTSIVIPSAEFVKIVPATSLLGDS
jgi:hypothetical protein